MSSQGRMINLKLAEYTPVSTKEIPNKSGGWLAYGDRNEMPEYLNELADSSAVHGVLCRRIADMIAGKGVTSNNQARVDQLDIYSAIQTAATDDKNQGGFYIMVRYANDGTLFSVKSLPFHRFRLAVDSETDEVVGVYYSKDWTDHKKKVNKPCFHPLFNPAKRPTKANNYEGEACQVLPVFFGKRGNDKYPKPDYFGALNDIETIRQMSMYHANTYLNGMFPSFIINFKNGIPEQDKIDEVRMQFAAQLEGAKNTGKYIINFNESGTEAPDITAFPMTEANTNYLTISREQSLENLFIGHSVTTPRLFGITTANNGLASNANEMKEGLKIMVSSVIEPRQRNIEAAFEKVLAIEGNISIQITPNTPIDLSEAVNADGTMAADVASQALNGAQIASLIDIIVQTATSVLTVPSAKAIVQAAFPSLTQSLIDNIFTGIVPGSVDPNAVAMRAVKLVTHYFQKREMTHEEEHHFIDKLQGIGEVVDSEEWELVSECEAASEHESEELSIQSIQSVASDYSKQMNFANEGSYANGDEKSKWGDSGLYKLRYAYSQDISDKSREFCKRMVALSIAGKVFRYEDIKAMGSDGVNGQFAPEGSSTYDIFTWKGGVYCHHFWKRQIYMRKRDKNGKIMPNDGLKNEIRVANVPYVPQKGSEGTKPINTPTRGSLKNA